MRAQHAMKIMISTTPPGDAVAPYVSAGPVYFGEFKDRFLREGGEWKFLERRGSIQMKFFGTTLKSRFLFTVGKV
jgi:hypothetical protein